jgi:hypothetical protein
MFSFAKLKARLTVYYSTIKMRLKPLFLCRRYFDNGAGYTNTNFVSQTLTHLDRKNVGGEFSFEYQITSTIKGSFSAGYGQFTHDSNPNVSINNDAVATVENTNPSFDFGTALLKKYKQAGMPQQAYGLGIDYRDPKYWWVGINIITWQIVILIFRQ